MIANQEQMKQIESDSGLRVSTLMAKAGSTIAKEIEARTTDKDTILILAGNGNNGGDGFVVAKQLTSRRCFVYLADGKPKSKTALSVYKKLDPEILVSEEKFASIFKQATVIIDAIYGFSFHGALKDEIRKLCDKVNRSNKKVYSIDINSGCEADSGECDMHSIHSHITFALDCYKPFHQLRKNHHMFEEVVLLPLGLPHRIQTQYEEMNEEIFFKNFPIKQENSYKNTFGKTMLIGGSYGMAGALNLNILGAKTIGAPYIEVALPEEIYPIVASKYMTPVFHPFTRNTYYPVIERIVENAKAVGFGSGAVYMEHKADVLDLILQTSHVPIVFDAEAFNILKNNTYLLRFAKAPVIITPHVGEFARIMNLSQEEIQHHRLKYASLFAKEYQVIVVLKSPNTIVASPSGEIYINQTGNPSLAQAGSGDLLTGMLTAMLTLHCDVFKAVCMAVWLHGHLADLGLQNQSIQNFDLESYPTIMDQLFQKYHR